MTLKFIFLFFALIFTSHILAASAGETLYNSNCSLCHGLKGDGKGVVGLALKPVPANFNDVFKSFKNEKVLKNHLLKILAEGKKENLMPAFKNLSEVERAQVADYLIGQHYKVK